MDVLRYFLALCFLAERNAFSSATVPENITYEESTQIGILKCLLTSNRHCDVKSAFPKFDVVFTGSKPSRRKRSTIQPSMSIYTTIASVTGGTVYHSDHNHVKDVIAVMKETVTTFPPITIKKFKMTSGAGTSFVVPIDETVREFNLKIEGTSSSSVSGSTAISLIQPNGARFTFSGNNTRKMLGLQLVVMKVVNPSPGFWKVRRRIIDTWQVECTGKSFLDFTYKLMQPGPGGFGEYPLTGRPIAGENMSILVNVAKYDIVKSFDEAILIDGNGFEVQNISLHNVGGRRGKSLFKGIMVIPAMDFRIAISGKDKHNNIFLRLNPIMISTLAIKLEVFPAPGTLYKNENITIPYRVSNVGYGSTGVEIAISDDLNFAQSPKSRHVTIRSHGSVNGTFILAAGNKKGETTTVSISAKADGAPSNKVQFRVQRITVNEHIIMKVDKIPPTCNVTAVHGKCDFEANICECSNMTWSMEVEAGDVGFGLLGVFASAASANHTFTKDPFSAGHTVDKGKIKARLSDDCCHQLAKVTVVDLAGLVAQCNVTITPNFIPPNPKLCLPDIPTSLTTTTTTTTTTTRSTTTRKLLPRNFTGSTTTTKPGATTTPTTTTSTTTLSTTTPVHITCTKISQTDCDLRPSCLTGPVACDNMNWTMKAKLSQNGIGRYFTIPKNAGRNAKLTYTNYALILTTDCCHPSAVVRFADIAGHIGQCDAKSVGTCDMRMPSCAGTGSTCGTSAAPPNCYDRYWSFNATFGTEGFGIYIVTPSSNSSFSHKTKTYSASADCCKTSITVTAVDARRNSGSCSMTATVLTDRTTTTSSIPVVTNTSSKANPQTTSKSEEKTTTSTSTTPMKVTTTAIKSSTTTIPSIVKATMFAKTTNNKLATNPPRYTMSLKSATTTVSPLSPFTTISAGASASSRQTVSLVPAKTILSGTTHAPEVVKEETCVTFTPASLAGVAVSGLAIIIALVTAVAVRRQISKMNRTVKPANNYHRRPKSNAPYSNWT